MRVQLRKSRDEGGAVALMVALLAMVLLVLAAFTTDFGMAYAQRQALSTGVDSAALSIIHQQYDAALADNSLTCTGMANDAATQQKASAAALTELNANSPFGQTIPASEISTNLSCVGANSGVLQVTVTVSHSVKTILGGFLGASSIPVSRVAAADLGVVNSVTGLRPIGVCQYQAQQIVADAAADAAAGKSNRAELISLSKIWKNGAGNQTCDGGGGSGNWGWLDLGQGKGDSALGDMIANGSPNPLTLNAGNPPTYSMGGSPGNKGNGKPVENGFQAIMDQTVTLPVYSTYSGNGANVNYTVVGFISVQMCGYSDNSKTVTGTCYDSSVPLQGSDMQVRYVQYTPAGELSDACSLGEISCSFDAYVTRLVR